jgi:circadian clock protein KaiB
MSTSSSNVGRLVLRLYIAGNGPNSLQAIANARAICDEHFAASYDLEVVDMLMHTNRALEDGVIVTPTLLKLFPLPAMRLIGSLSDSAQVRLALASE